MSETKGAGHLTRAQLGELRGLHAETVSALRRLEEGTYGLCTGCGTPIPYERLAAFPEAQGCGACTSGAA